MLKLRVLFSVLVSVTGAVDGSTVQVPSPLSTKSALPSRSMSVLTVSPLNVTPCPAAVPAANPNVTESWSSPLLSITKLAKFMVCGAGCPKIKMELSVRGGVSSMDMVWVRVIVLDEDSPIISVMSVVT